MGKIEGIKIQNYGVLKNIVLGKTRTNQNVRALGNLVAVIGESGNGKSTLADAFGFIADCLEMGVERHGWPRSFMYLQNGAGYAFEGNDDGGQDDDGSITGKKVEVQLSDIRRPGIVTLGAMKQYSRIEKFLGFLKSWYLCYFSPDAGIFRSDWKQCE